MPRDVRWIDEEQRRGRMPLADVQPGDQVAYQPVRSGAQSGAGRFRTGTVRAADDRSGGLWVEALVEDDRGAYRDVVFVRPDEVVLAVRSTDFAGGVERVAARAAQDLGVEALYPQLARLAGVAPEVWQSAVLTSAPWLPIEAERMLRLAAARCGVRSKRAMWRPERVEVALAEARLETSARGAALANIARRAAAGDADARQVWGLLRGNLDRDMALGQVCESLRLRGADAAP